MLMKWQQTKDDSTASMDMCHNFPSQHMTELKNHPYSSRNCLPALTACLLSPVRGLPIPHGRHCLRNCLVLCLRSAMACLLVCTRTTLGVPPRA